MCSYVFVSATMVTLFYTEWAGKSWLFTETTNTLNTPDQSSAVIISKTKAQQNSRPSSIQYTSDQEIVRNSLFVALEFLVSTYVVCERLSVMHKQVSGWTVNFCPNSPEHPSLEFQIKVPPLKWRLQIWVDQSSDQSTPPPKWRLQVWVDQSSDQSNPPQNEDFRSELTKVQIRVTPPPKWRLQVWVDQSSDQSNPPQNEDFRSELTKVQIRAPPPMKTSDFSWPKFRSESPPPIAGSFRMWRLIFIIRIIF